MSPDSLHTATSQGRSRPPAEGRRNSPLKAGTLKAGAPLKAGALKAAVEGRRAEGRRASDHGDDNNQTGLYGTLDGGRK